MSAGGFIAASAAAAGAAAAHATSVIGPIIVVRPEEFLKLLPLEDKPLLVEVMERRGVLRRRNVYVYLTSIKGLTFMTRSENRIDYREAVKIKGERLVLPQLVRANL